MFNSGFPIRAPKGATREGRRGRARGAEPGRPGRRRAGGLWWAGATAEPGSGARSGGRSPGAAAAGAPLRAAETRQARPGAGPGKGSRGGARAGGGEASPLLPRGWRRGGPAVAKENALPGQGRGGREQRWPEGAKSDARRKSAAEAVVGGRAAAGGGAAGRGWRRANATSRASPRGGDGL